MKKNDLIHVLCFIFSVSALSQNSIDIKADFDVENKSIAIDQTIQYYNDSDETQTFIYLNDWSNSYSTKNTPLAERFTQEFKNTFHFAKNEDRGFTAITSIQSEGIDLSFERVDQHPDILKVKLNSPFVPKGYYTLRLKYTVQVPDDKFTRYGVDDYGDYFLRYWYITPTAFDGEWHYYSNKDLDDSFVPKANLSLEVTYPKSYTLISELDEVFTKEVNNNKVITSLEGKDRVNTKLFLNKVNLYKTVETDFFTIQSNIEEEGLKPVDVAVISDRVAAFITKNLGNYPHKKILLTKIDYKKDPIYGLNLLPDFVRPFSDHFQYELKLLKTTLRNYLENTLLINPREDQWVLDGIQTYYLIKYIEENYPDMKIVGNLANVWGIRAFHAADLKFNDQYGFLYMHMARSNLDQPLNMPKDSLLKFNKNIANKYKAGVGLNYLDAYANGAEIKTIINKFLIDNKLKPTSASAFETAVKTQTKKNVDWFFKDYVGSSKKIDFKIKKIEKTEDSLRVTLKNKYNHEMPVSLFTMKDDTVVSKQWIDGFKGFKTVTVPRDSADKLVLNYDSKIPEINLRNNWKSVGGFFANNKPLQFRLFKDIEDPNYSQVFFMPEFDYNFYDGLSPGLKLYNKTLLSKNFLYRISPKYAIKSKQIVGGASVSYADRRDNVSNYYTKYGIGGSFYNYAPNLSYTSYTPYIDFRFRNPEDLRDNRKSYLNLRYVNIDREVDLTGEFETDGEPKYSVFNVRYGQSDPNLKKFSSWFTDLQLAKRFGKISGTLELRTLTENNRQYNLRLFAGAFLYNKTYQDTDFFSFALDRPTDYLFDYNYLGRSEEAGVLSQQLIVSEGGFKSQLEPAFANQWITTANASTTIWRYIMAYGDLGLVANRTENPKFVYDSGIRLNLVEDYFELYLPIYSNKGWEIAQPNYDQSIRFIVTLSPNTLLKLFTRRWY
ncbi:metalloprotease [Lacinutrix sp. Hel_I_90]|uniref:metalloprotease n=1 Tax=Lacinutrix sp. Hel_I_90 TaxID=1249999 RepID=UPI0005CA0E76|nr:metalloprotease [Lacinutrix sp. Hel_I_90]